MIEGVGIYKYPKGGERYEGEIHNYLRHGYGEYYNSNGTIIKGLWNKNKFVH